VKPSYRYNRYLKYPALGFNGGVAMAQDGDVHTLTTTWSPRYVLPRIVPVAHGVDLNIARLSQPDCLERLAPLLPAYEKWLEVTALRPVGKGLEGPKAAEQQQAEEAQLQQDLLEWKASLAQSVADWLSWRSRVSIGADLARKKAVWASHFSMGVRTRNG
jgi:hypothetical protein